MNLTDLTETAQKIKAAPDVRRLLAVSEQPDGFLLYLIETVHSYPCYVIGRVDPSLDDPAILYGCINLDNAWSEWAKRNKSDTAYLPPQTQQNPTTNP